MGKGSNAKLARLAQGQSVQRHTPSNAGSKLPFQTAAAKPWRGTTIGRPETGARRPAPPAAP